MMPSPIEPITESALRPRTSGRLATAVLLVVFIASASAYLLLASILGKIGLGQIWLNGMVLVIPVWIFIFAGYSTSISSAAGLAGIEEFKRAGGLVRAGVNAMSAAAEWLSLIVIIGLFAALADTNHNGIAIIIGAYCGFAFVAIFILPKLQRQDLVSLPAAILSGMRGSKMELNLLRVAIAILVILSAAIFFIAQIGAASRVLTLHFPISNQMAALALLTPVVITLLAGGMRALSLANIMLIWVIGAGLLLPAIWLSIDITGNPIPQLSYGDGALQPILQLETQLLQNDTSLAEKGFEQGNFTNLSGFADFLATVMSMMAAIAALPLLYSRLACTSGIAERTRTIGWTMLIVGLLVSVLPAFVIFMKFEIYRNFVGLPLNQLADGLEWVMAWARFENGDHALICGSTAIDLATIITACGNNIGHVLVPSDLQFSALMQLLGAGELSNMPAIYSAITFAGVLAAAVTAAGIAIMVVVNTASTELVFFRDREPFTKSEITNTAPVLTPIARRLFVSRLLIILLAAAGIWLAGDESLAAWNIFLWVFALTAATIFPILILALWWRGSTALGGLSGILAGFAAIVYFAFAIEFGPDLIIGDSNGQIWRLPFSDKPLRAMNLAIVIIPFTIAITIGVSIAQNLVKKWR